MYIDDMASSAGSEILLKMNSLSCAVSKLNVQYLPDDIVIFILRILSTSRAELYAPLICSHVCSHWRRLIINTPTLWSYIDTSRSEALNRLWLTRSQEALLHVRLSAPPTEDELMNVSRPYLTYAQEPCDPTSDLKILQDVMAQSHRWRSLEIAFAAISRIKEVLVSLKQQDKTLHLDLLSIGPMGLAPLLVDGPTHLRNGSSVMALAPVEGPSAFFRSINIQCKVLRIDTYPICYSPSLFSPALTVLEVYTGCYFNHDINPEHWVRILSATPNLVCLRLVSYRHQLFEINAFTGLRPPTLKLDALETLELTGVFVLFTNLFVMSTLPKLRRLLLDSDDVLACIVERLSALISVAPGIQKLSISSTSPYQPWEATMKRLSALQEITFFEMDAREAIKGIRCMPEYHALTTVRLEHIWDLNLRDPVLVRPLAFGLPPIELVDCVSGAYRACSCPFDTKCESNDGSNYSDNSSFDWVPGEPASSEEMGTDESESNYGESEGDGIGNVTQPNGT